MTNQPARKGVVAAAGLKAIWESAGGLPKLSRSGMFQHLAGRAFNNVARAPLTSLVTTVTIAIALFALAAFILALENVKSSVVSSRGDLVTSLYLKDSADQDTAQLLVQSIKKDPTIESVKLLTKEQALRQFRSALGEQAIILEGLEQDNPLPTTIEVIFHPQSASAELIDRFAAQYKVHPAVEYVQYSQNLSRQFSALMHTIHWGGLVAILLMLAVTSFIIANTIKLALYSHREEIEIMRLVGATDWFIRAPYLIEGIVQGFIGGILGLCGGYFVFIALRGVLLQSKLLQLVLPSLTFLSWSWCFAIILTGIVVGLCGSFLSVRRFSLE